MTIYSYPSRSGYKKPQITLGPNEDPHSTLSVLGRINKYLYWANEAAARRDIKAWYMQLENLYRELHWHMSDSEKETLKIKLPKVSAKVSLWEKSFKQGGRRIVDDEAVIVNELDLFLRQVANRKKLLLKESEHKPAFY